MTTSWSSRGSANDEVDWGSSAEATERRRRAVEAAKQRLAVIDSAAHYTATVRTADVRVAADATDRGYGAPREHVSSSHRDFDDREGASFRYPARPVPTRAVSPPRPSLTGAGTRVRATAGAGSYASMYDDRLEADALAAPAWDRPSTDTRWEKDVSREIGAVSKQLRRASVRQDDHGPTRTSRNEGGNVVRWEEEFGDVGDDYGHDVGYKPSAHNVRSTTSTATKRDEWRPKNPQTYARVSGKTTHDLYRGRDVDDGHGGDWVRTAVDGTVAKSPVRTGWNDDLFIPEQLTADRDDEREQTTKTVPRRAAAVTSKIGNTRSWEYDGFLQPEPPEAVFSSQYEFDNVNAKIRNDARRKPPVRDMHDDEAPGIQRTTSVGTARKLAALKAKRTQNRPTSRGDALRKPVSVYEKTTKQNDPEPVTNENDLSNAFPKRVATKRVPVKGATRKDGQTDNGGGWEHKQSKIAQGSNWGKAGAPSEYAHVDGQNAQSQVGAETDDTQSSYWQARVSVVSSTRTGTRTSDVLGETWEEFGTTQRPVAKVVSRTGLKPANARRGTAAPPRIREPSDFSIPESPEKFHDEPVPQPKHAPRTTGHGPSATTGHNPTVTTGHTGTAQPVDDIPRGVGVPEGADAGPSALHQCDTCGRKFNKKALAIHSRSCVKVFASKRATFNVAAQRAAGTGIKQKMGGGKSVFDDDDDDGYGGGFRPPKRSTRPVTKTKTISSRTRNSTSTRSGASTNSKPVPKWKKASEQFRAGLRGEGGGPDVEDLVPCPHCGRSYNEHAAERHIPQVRIVFPKS
jgi:hypothetical protein